MYPFGSLPDNLVAFGDVLRREYGFRIGAGELHDAARALEVVHLADQLTVRHALRPILSRTVDDTKVFDQAFTAFFFPGVPGVPQRGRDSVERTGGRGDAEQGRHAARREIEQEGGTEAVGASGAPVATSEAEEEGQPGLVRASYSPLHAEGAGAPEVTRVEAVWRDAARSLVRRLHLGLSRRWRPASRGRRFDLRRTLRGSVQTGGEALTPRWLRRPRRTPRFVLLVDGSRSMSGYAESALRIAVAMASVTMRIEVFTFSTALQRVTNDVRRAAAGETRSLEHLHHAWAGGTTIGACLRDFLRRFGDRMITRDTVVVIASDGLDVDAPDLLRDAMRELHRRSAGVVWLNPLLDTPGYAPTAGGMSAARPFVSTFTSATDAAGLRRLSRTIRLRA